jgi:hypothetical protein
MRLASEQAGKLASGQGKNYLPSLEGRGLRGGWEYANDPHLTSPLKGEEVLWNLVEYFTRTLESSTPRTLLAVFH